jgi:uncharacterized protein (UPF0261 family)
MHSVDSTCVVLAGALDTKHIEYVFVRDRLTSHGIMSIMLDFGVLGTAGIEADVTRMNVAAAAGTTLRALQASGDRNDAMVAMANGAAAEVSRLYQEGKVSGLIVLGGSNAGYVMGRLAQSLPFGVPKILVSTIVAGDTRPYVGTSDLTMMYPVVDISGVNSISRTVLAHAADACAGMLTAPAVELTTGKRSIAASMFGVTTACVSRVQRILESDGCEVHTFHANGVGGLTLEAMLRDGLFDAVVDITTTELADEMMGGVCSAGPGRLTAAGAMGIPQVVSVGALDMVNFGALETIPAKYRGRVLHAHNPAVTLMRTNLEECAALGKEIARKLNAATGPAEVLVPLRGFSQVSVKGAPFCDPAADKALIDALSENLVPQIPLHLIDTDINDPAFGAEVTQSLRRMLSPPKGKRSEE